MCAKIMSVEDHKVGQFYIDLYIDMDRKRFESMLDAQDYIAATKKTRGVSEVLVTLKEIVITAKRQLVYESCYVM